MGASVFVYLLLNKTKPPTMPDHLDRLRNDVIHNGKIPTKAQALEFGQAVIDVMKAPLGELMERRYGKALETVKG